MRIDLLVALVLIGLVARVPSQTEPLLQLSGQPYSSGSMTLHFIAPVGQPTLVLYGLDPLGPPLQTPKGPFYVGTVFNAVTLGAIPALGRIDVPFVVPPLSPALGGIPLVMQGYVPGALTNPTTLPLDQPYYVPADATILTSPNAEEVGLFGDRMATGDLNGDGSADIVVGAWGENAGDIDSSGRAYVFWGPAMAAVTTLEPSAPKFVGLFGQGVVIGDLNGDGVDDLVVGEGNGDPPPPSDPGHLNIYLGGASFAPTPVATIASAGTGTPYQQFGHTMSLGDLNGDGRPDAAVGEPLATVQGFSNAGQLEVRFGPNLLATQVVTAPDTSESGFLGDRLAIADVTGDGIDDLIVGAPRKKLGGLIAMGRVYLFAGPNLDHLKTLDHPLPSGSNSRFGNAVAGADLNGDGISEVIATDQRNHAFIFWSPNFDDYLLITRPPDPITGTAISISFGYFATSGDVNGDGLADLVVGEPFAASKGRVYAALAPYFSDFHILTDKVPEQFAEFGWGVHVADVDGDGRAELLVGSDTADPNGIASAGRVTVFDLDVPGP